MSKNKSGFLIVGVSIVVVAVVGLYYWLNTNTEEPKVPLQESSIASHAVSYTKDGVISLYDVEEGLLLGDFDLKTLSDHPELVKDVEVELPSDKLTLEMTSDVVQKETVKNISVKSNYLYYGDVEAETLYAYSNVDKEVYQITQSEGKLDVKEAIMNAEFVTADDLIVTEGRLILTESGTNKLQIIDLQDGNSVQVLELEGDPTHMVVNGDEFFYTFEDRVGKFNMTTKEKLSVLMGDESLDLLMIEDKLYVLNAFGKQTTNSLLMKVNPDDLKVDNLLELKTDESMVVSRGESHALYIGRVTKENDISGTIQEKNEMTSINLKSLSVEKSNEFVPFSKESLGYNSHIYMLQEGKLNIYATNDVILEKSFEVNGEYFTILP